VKLRVDKALTAKATKVGVAAAAREDTTDPAGIVGTPVMATAILAMLVCQVKAGMAVVHAVDAVVVVHTRSSQWV